MVNSASGAKCVTAKQLWNLATFGFLDVKINDALSGSTCKVSVDKSGKPDLEFIECRSDQASALADYLRKTGWSLC